MAMLTVKHLRQFERGLKQAHPASAPGFRAGPTGLRAELTATATCCACIELFCPADVVVNTCSNGAPAHFSNSGTNRCSTNLTINCNLASITGIPVTPNTIFPLGTNLVNCITRDACGRVDRCSFNVILVPDAFTKTLHAGQRHSKASPRQELQRLRYRPRQRRAPARLESMRALAFSQNLVILAG